MKIINRWLVHKYPFLVPRYWDTGQIVHDYNYSYTELDEMPVGWRKAFGLQMCKELKKALIENNCLDGFQIIQIKEKFGGLRFYTSPVPQAVYDVIRKYEDKSCYTCIMCGKPATQISTNWISPWCDKCADKLNRKKSSETFTPIDMYYK